MLYKLRGIKKKKKKETVNYILVEIYCKLQGKKIKWRLTVLKVNVQFNICYLSEYLILYKV